MAVKAFHARLQACSPNSLDFAADAQRVRPSVLTSAVCTPRMFRLQPAVQVKQYKRNPTTMRAGPELRAVHPLGKSPVVTDGGTVIAESGAAPGCLAWPTHWMHMCIHGLMKHVRACMQ